VFCGLRQSFGEVVVFMKLPCPGWSLLLNVKVVAEVLHWCPSLNLPHWYKSPYEFASVLLVATCVAPKLRSIHTFDVVGFVTSTTVVATLPADAQKTEVEPSGLLY
jgi:hypothetical protein